MKYIFSLVLLLFISSCTKIIEVPLETAPPKLVIEATIVWNKGTTGSNQIIKLSTSTDFYSTQIPVVSNAMIEVSNSAGVVFPFIEMPNSGEYVCTNFVPVINEVYTLKIQTGGNTYIATETLQSVTPITSVVQETIPGFSGNTIRVKANYNDPIAENFYLFSYQYDQILKPDFYANDDKFYNGNPFFSISFNEDLKAGDILHITHFGISKTYYEYLNILLTIAGNTGGAPFQAPPVSVRGNVINTTNPENFPFGYFSLSESDTKSYTVQ
jgi:hypothetical protein